MRENGVEIISPREYIDGDSAMGLAMLHLAIVFAEMETRLARGKTLVELETVKATGDGWICREGIRRAAIGHLRGSGCHREAADSG